ncbi:hypothetical protein BDV19DRAFT_368451 [Aspergillus venezuelensis]
MSLPLQKGLYDERYGIRLVNGIRFLNSKIRLRSCKHTAGLGLLTLVGSIGASPKSDCWFWKGHKDCLPTRLATNKPFLLSECRCDSVIMWEMGRSLVLGGADAPPS